VLPPRTWTGPICAITATTWSVISTTPPQVTGYQDQGVTVIKGRAAFTGPGTVTVANCEVSAGNIRIATGSEPIIPPIVGRADEPVWTNREATNLTEIRHRAVIVGGSAVGSNWAPFPSRFETHVTIGQSADRLLDREIRVGDSMTPWPGSRS
jgi:pyruvate/2-oxoglutarate dehydrogenase complex dihydrolipoamide dehydrogenase (E3) component